MSASHFKTKRLSRRSLPGHKPRLTPEEIEIQRQEAIAAEQDAQAAAARKIVIDAASKDDTQLLYTIDKFEKQLNDANSVTRTHPARIAAVNEHYQMMRRILTGGVVCMVLLTCMVTTYIFVLHVFIPIIGMVGAIGMIGMSRLMLKFSIGQNRFEFNNLSAALEIAESTRGDAPDKIRELKEELKNQRAERKELEAQLTAAYPKLNTAAACAECDACPHIGEDVDDWAYAHHAMTGH